MASAAISVSAFPLIFASGELDSNGSPLQHDIYAAASLDLASGQTQATSTGRPEIQHLRNVRLLPATIWSSSAHCSP